MKSNTMLHDSLSYLVPIIGYINEVSCNNASQTQSAWIHQSSLVLGGRFGYVSAGIGIVITGICVSTLAYLYKNIHSSHEPESLRCIGENDVDSNALYDM